MTPDEGKCNGWRLRNKRLANIGRADRIFRDVRSLYVWCLSDIISTSRDIFILTSSSAYRRGIGRFINIQSDKKLRDGIFLDF